MTHPHRIGSIALVGSLFAPQIALAAEDAPEASGEANFWIVVAAVVLIAIVWAVWRRRSRSVSCVRERAPGYRDSHVYADTSYPGYGRDRKKDDEKDRDQDDEAQDADSGDSGGSDDGGGGGD